jgi:hypothetical protein
VPDDSRWYNLDAFVDPSASLYNVREAFRSIVTTLPSLIDHANDFRDGAEYDVSIDDMGRVMQMVGASGPTCSSVRKLARKRARV